MSWEEIKEIDNSEIGYIGHHSHTHEYLIDVESTEFINDIETATEIFKENLGYVPKIFSYPFGEYSLSMKKYIAKNFEIAFGQHSGIIDRNKIGYYVFNKLGLNLPSNIINKFNNKNQYPLGIELPKIIELMKRKGDI